MMVRQLSHLARLGLVITASVGATSAACSKKQATPPPEPPTLTAGGAPAQSFKFAPPDGTKFVRYDRRREERSIVGAPMRTLDEEELRWKVSIDKSGDHYSVKQDLTHLTLKRNGKVVADGDVKEGISAELVIDKDGNLQTVKGLDKTAARLRELAAPGMEQAVAQTFTPQYLSDLVANRYRVLFGETIGRPATPGASWTVTNPPGSFVASRKVTVERIEPCGDKTCARLREDFNIDSRVMADTAVAMVKARIMAAGGDPSAVTVRSASYGMSGAMLVEPATMLNHGASLAETGNVTVSSKSGEDLTVELKGNTEIVYAYPPSPVATEPASKTTRDVASN
jgi:hypothetical protein